MKLNIYNKFQNIDFSLITYDEGLSGWNVECFTFNKLVFNNTSHYVNKKIFLDKDDFRSYMGYNHLDIWHKLTVKEKDFCNRILLNSVKLASTSQGNSINYLVYIDVNNEVTLNLKKNLVYSLFSAKFIHSIYLLI